MSSEVEAEIANGDVDVGIEAAPQTPTQHRPIESYESAAERARDVHIRDLDLPPRWNGHAPTDTVAYGEEMPVSRMVVCKECGAVAGSREDMAEKECSA